MAQILMGTPVSAPLIPGTDDLNEWPTHSAKYGQGGFQVVGTIVERDAITGPRRDGKMVYVKADSKFYRYDGAWVEVSMPSSFMDVKDDTGVNRVGHAGILEFVGATVSQGDDPRKAIVTIQGSKNTIDVSGHPTSSVNDVASLEFVGASVAQGTTPDKAVVTINFPNQPGSDSMNGFFGYTSGRVNIPALTGAAETATPIFCNDVVVADPVNITPNIKTKSYDLTYVGNVMVASKVSMAGTYKGSVQGYVRLFMKDVDSGEVLRDSNGNLFSVARLYSTGDELGSLVLCGFLQVSARIEVQLCVEFSNGFNNFGLELEDRIDGGTCLMFQPVESDSQSGPSMRQFEIDTGINIQYTTYNLGDVANLNYILTQNVPMTTGAAHTGSILADGWFFNPLTPMQMGISGGEIDFQDDGTHGCFFAFGNHVQNAVTKLLRGKTIKVVVDIATPQTDFLGYVAEWTGFPDDFSWEVIDTVDDKGKFTLKPGWSIVGNPLDFQPDGVNPEWVAGELTVPTTANNFCVFLVPQDNTQPTSMSLKGFSFGLKVPEYKTVVHGTNTIDEAVLDDKPDYAEFVQDDQGYGGLRYTINNRPTPMPVGMLKKGNAPVDIDRTVNIISGSLAKGGEGAYRFNKSGSIRISPEMMFFNEGSTDSTVKVWFSTVKPDGITFNKIPESETTVTVPKLTTSTGLVVALKTFSIVVNQSDRIVCFAQANRDDGAFIESTNPHRPMVQNVIEFDILISSIDGKFRGVDITQFNKVYSTGMWVVSEVTNVASKVINLALPTNSDVVVLSAVKKGADGVVEPVAKLSYKYDPAKSQLTVSFGETVANAHVLLGIYM